MRDEVLIAGDEINAATEDEGRKASATIER
jgi:hypothetical protein